MPRRLSKCSGAQKSRCLARDGAPINDSDFTLVRRLRHLHDAPRFAVSSAGESPTSFAATRCRTATTAYVRGDKTASNTGTTATEPRHPRRRSASICDHASRQPLSSCTPTSPTPAPTSASLSNRSPTNRARSRRNTDSTTGWNIKRSVMNIQNRRNALEKAADEHLVDGGSVPPPSSWMRVR